MAASVSDIAAMSGLPQYSLVSLSLPPQMFFDDAVGLFDGLSETANFYSCPISGGETTSTNGPVTVTVTVIGKVERDRMVLRTTAVENDWIYATGYLGDAMGGLTAFDKGEPGFETLKGKFLTPEAQISLSRELTESFRISSMIDLSDGLATDIANICRESNCGAKLYEECLPISDDLIRLADKYRFDPVFFALSAGEDFGLLFTSSDEFLPDKFTLNGCPVSRIGKIVNKSRGIKMLHSNGFLETVTIKGYEHFKS
jgi:thiamine-monophosphate kinase